MRTKHLILAIGVLTLMIGCAPKDPRTEPLMVSPKKHFWEGWGDSLAASSDDGKPTGEPFKYDGKAE